MTRRCDANLLHIIFHDKAAVIAKLLHVIFHDNQAHIYQIQLKKVIVAEFGIMAKLVFFGLKAT